MKKALVLCGGMLSAFAVLPSTAQAGVCSPATINAGSIYAMHPYMRSAEVLGLLRCAPSMVVPSIYPQPFMAELQSIAKTPPSPGGIDYFFEEPLGGVISVQIDSVQGLLGAEYLAPGGVAGVGGMVLINPIRWQVSKGIVAP